MVSVSWLPLALLALLASNHVFAAMSTILPNHCDDVQRRLELRELAQNADQMTVFLLGLKRMKEANATDPASWYSIAGIHGWPFHSYNDVQRCANCSGNVGYCPHASHIFAIWHRPYLALWERALRSNAIAAVNAFPEGQIKRQFSEMARTLRMPYWDFAKPAPPGQNILPSILTEEWVTLQQPQGRERIRNPLFQYDFVNVEAPDWDPLVKQKTTRHPMQSNHTVSRNDLAIQAVQKLQEPAPDGKDMRCSLYRLLFSEQDINRFGGSAYFNGAITYPYANLESLHDDVHIALGGDNDSEHDTGKGTMFYISSSAYDPVFWMHHAMVDRLLAIYQGLHPDTWIEGNTGTDTINIAGSMWVDSKTPLAPFFMNTNGTPWTADSSRWTTTFCYDYRDVNNGSSVEEVSAAVNKIYGQGCMVNPQMSSAQQKPLTSTDNAVEMIFGRDTTNLNSHSLATLSDAVPSLTTDTGAMRDYVVNIRMDSKALGETATVYLFDGPVDEDVPKWDYSPYLLGKRTFLAKGMRAEMSQMRKGAVDINAVLMRRVQDGVLEGLSNGDVSEYLKDMTWKVVKADGSIVSTEEVPGLMVTVVTADVQPATHESELPVWGNPQLLKDITAGKAGGWREEEGEEA